MSKIAVIINSCYKFHKITINEVMTSAKNAKIPGENIYQFLKIHT